MTSLADILVSAWGDPEQGTQLSCARLLTPGHDEIMHLCLNLWQLVCYTAIENESNCAQVFSEINWVFLRSI